MPDAAALGLRGRRRLETRLRSETAAVGIVTAEGLGGATVNMISERAFALTGVAGLLLGG